MTWRRVGWYGKMKRILPVSRVGGVHALTGWVVRSLLVVLVSFRMGSSRDAQSPGRKFRGGFFLVGGQFEKNLSRSGLARCG